MTRRRDIADLLAGQEQLSTLSPDQLQLLAGCAHLAAAGRGHLLASEGDPAETFFLVRSGRVALEARAPGAALRIDSAGPGELVGWSWLFPPHRWLFDARVVETTRLIEVDATCIRDKCERDHEFGYRLMRSFSAVLVDRLTSTRIRLLDLYGSTR